MSNCVVRSRGSRLPCSIVADHGIEGGIIFRMTATIMTLGFLLIAARRLWKTLRAGLYRAALRAAM